MIGITKKKENLENLQKPDIERAAWGHSEWEYIRAINFHFKKAGVFILHFERFLTKIIRNKRVVSIIMAQIIGVTQDI